MNRLDLNLASNLDPDLNTGTIPEKRKFSAPDQVSYPRPDKYSEEEMLLIGQSQSKSTKAKDNNIVKYFDCWRSKSDKQQDKSDNEKDAQQQAKTSDKSLHEQPRQRSEGQDAKIKPQRLALHCGDASDQQLDQNLSQMVLIQDGQKLNFNKQREAVYKECYFISSELKSKGYGAKHPIPPKNAGTGNRLREDLPDPLRRQVSFKEKVSRCCEAVCQACLRCLHFRNPFG